MRHLSSLVVAAVLGLSVAPAFASEDLCTGTGPQKTADEVKAQYEAQGYKVKKFGTEDGCFELKGTDPAGKKVEMYISPWTAEVVKTKTY